MGKKNIIDYVLGMGASKLARFIGGGHGEWNPLIDQISYDYLLEDNTKIYRDTRVARTVTDREFSIGQHQDLKTYNREVGRVLDQEVEWEVRDGKLWTEYRGKQVSLDELLEKNRRCAYDTQDFSFYNESENTALLNMQNMLVSGEANAVAYAVHHPDGVRYVPLMKWSEDKKTIISTYIDVGVYFHRDIKRSEANVILTNLGKRFGAERFSEGPDEAYTYLVFKEKPVEVHHVKEAAQLLVVRETLAPYKRFGEAAQSAVEEGVVRDWNVALSGGVKALEQDVRYGIIHRGDTDEGIPFRAPSSGEVSEEERPTENEEAEQKASKKSIPINNIEYTNQARIEEKPYILTLIDAFKQQVDAEVIQEELARNESVQSSPEDSAPEDSIPENSTPENSVLKNPEESTREIIVLLQEALRATSIPSIKESDDMPQEDAMLPLFEQIVGESYGDISRHIIIEVDQEILSLEEHPLPIDYLLQLIVENEEGIETQLEQRQFALDVVHLAATDPHPLFTVAALGALSDAAEPIMLSVVERLEDIEPLLGEPLSEFSQHVVINGEHQPLTVSHLRELVLANIDTIEDQLNVEQQALQTAMASIILVGKEPSPVFVLAALGNIDNAVVPIRLDEIKPKDEPEEEHDQADSRHQLVKILARLLVVMNRYEDQSIDTDHIVVGPLETPLPKGIKLGVDKPNPSHLYETAHEQKEKKRELVLLSRFSFTLGLLFLLEHVAVNSSLTLPLERGGNKGVKVSETIPLKKEKQETEKDNELNYLNYFCLIQAIIDYLDTMKEQYPISQRQNQKNTKRSKKKYSYLPRTAVLYTYLEVRSWKLDML